MKLLVVVLSALVCQMAVAKDIMRAQYEINLKPEKAKSVVLPSLGIVTANTNSSTAVGSGNQSGMRLGVEYLYGNTADWAYGTRVSYSDIGSKSSNVKGMHDFEFVAKSKKEYKNETLLYGGTFYWSPEKSRQTGTSSNNFSGGFAFEPYGALVKKFKDSRMTFQLAYTKTFNRKFADTSSKPSRVGDIVGGDVATASVIYDYFYKDSTIGASAASYSFSDELYQLSNAPVRSESQNVFKGEVYWMGNVSPGVKFIPSIQYLEVLNSQTGDFTGTQINLAYMKNY